MTGDELLSRITINPNICFGKPCIRGHRIWVVEADILACIAYGAEMSRERYFEIHS